MKRQAARWETKIFQSKLRGTRLSRSPYRQPTRLLRSICAWSGGPFARPVPAPCYCVNPNPTSGLRSVQLGSARSTRVLLLSHSFRLLESHSARPSVWWSTESCSSARVFDPGASGRRFCVWDIRGSCVCIVEFPGPESAGTTCCGQALSALGCASGDISDNYHARFRFLFLAC